MRSLILRLAKFSARFFVSFAVLAILAIMGSWLWISMELPPARSVLSRPLASCPIEAGKKPIQLSELPAYVPNAFVVAEAPAFWNLQYVPTIRTLAQIPGAAFSDMKIPPRSFSTMLAAISVRDAFPLEGRSAMWHIRNAVQADRMEMALTKSEILEAALNQMYFGNGITGFNCAASYYFLKQGKALKIAEAGLLAGLVRGPSIYNPIQHPDRALERRNWVIEQLYQENHISQKDAEQATASPLQVTPLN
jgi:membrane carboxypeptidase/penicillin-binding protein